MQKFHLSDFTAGWVVGNFSPSAASSEHFEFGVKHFLSGETEPRHYQRIARELSVVVSGECQIGDFYLSAGDVLLIDPGEVAGFEAFSDCAIAVIKWPSLPSDKVLE